MPVPTSIGWWGLGDHQGPHRTTFKEITVLELLAAPEFGLIALAAMAAVAVAIWVAVNAAG